MSKSLGPLNDVELNKLLSAANNPPELAGFEQRLAVRLAGHSVVVPQHNNVVPFKKIDPPVSPPKFVMRRISIATAMAASLLLGLFAGNSQDVISLFEGVTDISTIGQLAEFAPLSLDDIGKLDGETQS